MSTQLCGTCKRPKANDVDWAAFEEIQDCTTPDCAWGGDRCWYTDDCGFVDLRTAPLTLAGKQLRAGRPLTQVAHTCPPVPALNPWS